MPTRRAPSPASGSPRRASEQISRFTTVDEAAEYFTQQKLLDPTFEAPEGYRWDGTRYVRDTNSGFDDFAKYLGMGSAIGFPLYGAGALAAGALGGGGGAAATTAGISGPGSTAGIPAGMFGGAGAGAAGGGGIAGTVGKVAGALTGGTDMKKLLTMLGVQGGFDLLGGLFGQGGPNGFDDPQARLDSQFDAIKKLTDGVTKKMAGGYDLSPSAIPQTAKPISIPNVPFQIGGGMGMDPAIRDPKLMQRPGLDVQGLLGGSTSTAGGTGARRRPPSGRE